MLVLKRNPGERIIIGKEIEIEIIGVRGNQVRLGITAPKNVCVDREEVFHRKLNNPYPGTEMEDQWNV